jgi:pimeloyl-ACP methyl ester carboxylesterase
MTSFAKIMESQTRSRRHIMVAAVAASVASLLPAAYAANVSASNQTPIPEGPGSTSGAPYLPQGFTDTFTSRYIDIGGLRLHAVIGGKGPPLLLVHGWPQTWYQWRLVMPALARDFKVIAIDQRGIGLSDKPQSGYDAGTQANDMVALMEALGYKRFAMVGFDTGMPIAYAVAADHPERLARLVVGEAIITGVTPSPPLLVPGPLNKRLWHIAFNRLGPEVNEALVRGRRRLLRRGVRGLGRNTAARRGGQVLFGPTRLQPRCAARQLRIVSRDRYLHRRERAPQEDAAHTARPCRRRGKEHRRGGREHDEARRGRRAIRRHP